MSTGAIVRRASRFLQALVPRSDGGLVILAYHLVGAGTDSPVDLPRRTFRRQMEELRREEGRGRVRILRLREAEGWLATPESHRRTGVVVTFDDAYENFAEEAWPILRELSIPATLYVPVGFLDGTSPAPISGTAGLPPLAWEQLRDLVGSGGLEAGSHTLTHPDLPGLPEEEVRRELVESRRLLEERLGTKVESLAYPRALASPRAIRLAGKTYRTAVVAGGRKITPSEPWPAHALPRLPVRRDEPVPLLPRLQAKLWLPEFLASRWRGARLRRR